MSVSLGMPRNDLEHRINAKLLTSLLGKNKAGTVSMTDGNKMPTPTQQKTVETLFDAAMSIPPPPSTGTTDSTTPPPPTMPPATVFNVELQERLLHTLDAAAEVDGVDNGGLLYT